MESQHEQSSSSSDMTYYTFTLPPPAEADQPRTPDNPIRLNPNASVYLPRQVDSDSDSDCDFYSVSSGNGGKGENPENPLQEVINQIKARENNQRVLNWLDGVNEIELELFDMDNPFKFDYLNFDGLKEAAQTYEAGVPDESAVLVIPRMDSGAHMRCADRQGTPRFVQQSKYHSDDPFISPGFFQRTTYKSDPVTTPSRGVNIFDTPHYQQGRRLIDGGTIPNTPSHCHKSARDDANSAFEAQKNDGGYNTLVWVTCCLQCSLKGLPCTKTLPACARCVRAGEAMVCLPQFLEYRATGEKPPMLLGLAGEDEKTKTWKQYLQRELISAYRHGQESTNWVYPRPMGEPKSPRIRRTDEGNLLVRANRTTQEHPGYGRGGPRSVIVELSHEARKDIELRDNWLAGFLSMDRDKKVRSLLPTGTFSAMARVPIFDFLTNGKLQQLKMRDS